MTDNIVVEPSLAELISLDHGRFYSFVATLAARVLRVRTRENAASTRISFNGRLSDNAVARSDTHIAAPQSCIRQSRGDGFCVVSEVEPQSQTSLGPEAMKPEAVR